MARGWPRFAKSCKASYISIRITQETRDLVEAEARRHGETLSATAENLLQIGLGEKATRRNREKVGRPFRALCFLLEQLNLRIRGVHHRDQKYTWHSNPYMFEAFRTAVLDLIDEVRPPGEVVTPPPVRRSTFPDVPADYGHRCAESSVFFAASCSRKRLSSFRRR